MVGLRKIMKEVDTREWYQIKATHPKYPEVGELTFWLYRENKKEVHKIVIERGYQNIKWIRNDFPPLLKENDKT
mgnify:FL=1